MPKEEQLSDFKTVLNIVDILSMAKVLENRKLWLISFFYNNIGIFMSA